MECEYSPEDNFAIQSILTFSPKLYGYNYINCIHTKYRSANRLSQKKDET